MALLFAGGVLVLLGVLLSLSRDQVLRIYGRLLIVFGLIFGGLAFSFGCAASRTGVALNIGVGVSATADYVTTRQGIARGAREANPLMGQDALRQALVKIGGVGTVIGAAYLLDLKGASTWAHVVRAAAIVLNIGVSVLNHEVQR